jgi:hypothetical protein
MHTTRTALLRVSKVSSRDGKREREREREIGREREVRGREREHEKLTYIAFDTALTITWCIIFRSTSTTFGTPALTDMETSMPFRASGGRHDVNARVACGEARHHQRGVTVDDTRPSTYAQCERIAK